MDSLSLQSFLGLPLEHLTLLEKGYQTRPLVRFGLSNQEFFSCSYFSLQLISLRLSCWPRGAKALVLPCSDWGFPFT